MRNRFEILASLPAADDFEDPVGAIKTESSEPVQITHVEPQPQLQEEQLPPRNPWEVPDCVDKPIPCVLNVVAKPEPVRVATKAAKKPARPKPELPVESDEHDEEEQTTVEAPKQHTPIVWSYHPPQPHKFRQTPASAYPQCVTLVHDS